MGILDGLLGQVGGAGGIADIAARVGLPREQVEAAIGALAKSHAEPGDTVAGAADKTGLPTDALGQIMAQLGGETGLGSLSGLLQKEGMLGQIGGMLDRDGDGNPINDITAMAGKFFGKN